MSQIREENKISVRFLGINPKDLNLRDVLSLLVEYERAIRSISKVHYPDVKPKDLLFSLVEIKHESAGFVTQPQSPVHDYYNNGLRVLSNCTNNGEIHKLPLSSRKYMQSFTNKMLKLNIDSALTFSENEQASLTITPRIKYYDKLSESTKEIKEYTTIYGQFTGMQTDKKTITIKAVSGEYIDINIPDELMEEFHKYLIKGVNVAVEGVAKRDPSTFAIKSFKLDDYIILSGKKFTEALRDLSKNFSNQTENLDRLLNDL